MAWEPDYLEADDLAAYLRIEDADAEGDATELALAVTAASRSIDDYCRRQFGSTETAEARTFGWSCGTLHLDDVATDAGFLVNGVAIPTGWLLGPVNAVSKGRPYTRLCAPLAEITDDPVIITAVWGWPVDVPVPVQQACRVQAARFFKRRDAPFGIAGSPEAGSEMRLLAKLDPDVAVMLRRYRRIARPW